MNTKKTVPNKQTKNPKRLETVGLSGLRESDLFLKRERERNFSPFFNFFYSFYSSNFQSIKSTRFRAALVKREEEEDVVVVVVWHFERE